MIILKKCIASALVLSTTLAALPLPAHAQLVPTETLVAQQRAGEAAAASRDRVAAFMARADVEAAMREQGVDADAARARVQALSDEEVAQLDGRIAQAPAGGDVLGLVFSVFVLLLVTDILGFTKVFPFTRSIR